MGKNLQIVLPYHGKFNDDELIEEVIPSWEERIILIKADNMDDADKKSIIFAKEYENEYILTLNCFSILKSSLFLKSLY